MVRRWLNEAAAPEIAAVDQGGPTTPRLGASRTRSSGRRCRHRRTSTSKVRAVRRPGSLVMV